MALKTKELLKNNGCSFVSAFLAGAFFLFACYYFKAYPFDENYCLLYSDLSQGYYPTLVHLHDLLKSGESILYSWSSSLGYPYFGSIGWFLSPCNLIFLLFSRENIAFSITIIILAKIMVIAYCFSYYLRKAYNHKGVFNIVPSLLYAFSGFVVAYYCHFMWLDLLYSLPLIILGFHKLINDNKPLLYLCMLTYLMILDCYSAYMFCIFLCLYFIYYYLKNNGVKEDLSQGFFKSRFFKTGLSFAGFSIISALLASIMLIPTFFMLKTVAATSDTFEIGLKIYYNPFSFLAQQFSGSSVMFQNIGDPMLPNCWSGLLTIILVPAYLISNHFSKKERILDISFLAVMFLSLSVNLLSFVWCGFHFANGFADRYAYFYIFIALTVMSKALNNIEKIKKPIIVICSFCAALFIVLMRLVDPDKTEKYTLIISLGFTAVWLAVYLISWIKKTDKALLKLVVLFIACMELAFAQLENLNFNSDKRDYDRYSEEFNSAYSIVSDSSDDLFFRVEACEPQNDNYPFLMNYNGITGFSSIIPQTVLKNQNAIGADADTYNFIMYYPQTPVYNSIFSIKYLIGETKSFPYVSDYFNCIGGGYYSGFENNYYLPLGYCVNSAAVDFNSEPNTNPFYQQNKLFSSFCDVSSVFNCYDYNDITAENATYEISSADSSSLSKTFNVKTASAEEPGTVTFKYTLPDDGEYYLYISHYTYQNKTKIEFCNRPIKYAKTVSDSYVEPNGILPLGQGSGGDTLNITFEVNKKTEKKPISVYLASFNKDVFIEGYNRLAKNALNLTEFENTHLKGSITADKECLLFTSIPYNKGWHVTLDGVCVKDEDIVKIDNAYISIPLTEGAHTVEFNYLPYGLKTGVAISSVSLIALIVVAAIKKKRQKKL